jgi:hypothetical protein
MRPIDHFPKPAGWVHTVAQAQFLDRCAKCGTKTALFRDQASRAEYQLSGMCQSCQDAFFVEQDYPDSAWNVEGHDYGPKEAA